VGNPTSPAGPGHSISHLENPNIYEKPSITRRVIEWLVGCGVPAAEGNAHKRQRRIAEPAFSIQNMRAFVPLVFNKGEELKDRWMGLVQEQAVKDTQMNPTGLQLDVCEPGDIRCYRTSWCVSAVSLHHSISLWRHVVLCSGFDITSMPSKTKTTNCSKHIKICSRMRFPSLEA
jgi:hypothetical protein